MGFRTTSQMIDKQTNNRRSLIMTIKERSLPRNHSEKSLLTEEEVPW